MFAIATGTNLPLYQKFNLVLIARSIAKKSCIMYDLLHGTFLIKVHFSEGILF